MPSFLCCASFPFPFHTVSTPVTVGKVSEVVKLSFRFCWSGVYGVGGPSARLASSEGSGCGSSSVGTVGGSVSTDIGSAGSSGVVLVVVGRAVFVNVVVPVQSCGSRLLASSPFQSSVNP